jgi:hypothetical protein
MKRGQKPSAEQVVVLLRQTEVQAAQGKSIALACKKADVFEQSYRCWRNAYGGLKIDQAKKMKDLERENARLRRLVVDLFLVSQVLADVASENLRPPSDAGTRWTASEIRAPRASWATSACAG